MNGGCKKLGPVELFTRKELPLQERVGPGNMGEDKACKKGTTSIGMWLIGFVLFMTSGHEE